MSKPLRVVIIDDEKPAVDILSRFVQKISFLELIESTTDAFEGLNILNTQEIDLLLVDIEMPDINGVELVKSLTREPMIIFTTAFKEYAIDGYELDVIDYLLKPIRFERFLKAVNKANQLYSLKHPENRSLQESILIKVEYKTIRLKFEDIIYIEGCKDYVKIFTTNGMQLTRLNLKNIQSKLPEAHFMRIHRSYIVSFSKVVKFQKNEIYLGDKVIPIGESYKEHVLKRLE